MNKIKKTILTLVALLAVTTGAWAQDDVKLTTTEIVPPAAWNNDYSDLLPSDMPGLKADAITEEQAMAWADVPKTGMVALIYGYVDTGNWIEYNIINFYDGLVDYTNSESLSHGTVYYYANTGIKKYYYVTGTAAPSGPEVAWDKAEKTGTFTMPGGNVELEPEYYPQAALTAAPTAINDVPATTDGAIVNAGTVANIDGTTTAQGTVMYYAVQSATAPTAPDYDATGWTDKVPTATDFAEGNVYVWYYVKGADGDETSTFSDGAITKLGESGYITLLAAPTYAVTFADDTAEPDKWTASPNADVTKGQPVTVTYTGTKKVLGVKAEKKAPAVPKAAKDATAEDVGKLIGADGNIYDDAGAATAANTTAVAMIAYVGTASDCTHGLAIALADESGTKDYGAAGTACSGKAAVTVGTWRLPSEKDWQYMFIGCGSSESYSAPTSSMSKSYSGLASKLTTAQGDALQTAPYWSSTEDSPGYRAWFVYFDGSVAHFDVDDEYLAYPVRACLAF